MLDEFNNAIQYGVALSMESGIMRKEVQHTIFLLTG